MRLPGKVTLRFIFSPLPSFPGFIMEVCPSDGNLVAFAGNGIFIYDQRKANLVRTLQKNPSCN